MDVACEHCKKAKATVHITDVPEKRERHLCEACAQSEGVIIKQTHQTTTEILQEFIKQKTGLGAVDEQACPHCGVTFREFRAKGQLGCPRDYEVFREALIPMIQRAHGSATHHIGKVPSTADETVRRQTGAFKLRRELDQAIQDENYELAARVRDQLKALDGPASA